MKLGLNSKKCMGLSIQDSKFLNKKNLTYLVWILYTPLDQQPYPMDQDSIVLT